LQKLLALILIKIILLSRAGDGGMEYPMATLIKNFSPGTAIHEFMHSWYYGLMSNNESLYPWMDEGLQRIRN
jgi:hypothetical protein